MRRRSRERDGPRRHRSPLSLVSKRISRSLVQTPDKREFSHRAAVSYQDRTQMQGEMAGCLPGESFRAVVQSILLIL